MASNEEWRSIPDNPNFIVSNWGRVKKLVSDHHRKQGLLNIHKQSNGYLNVCIGSETIMIHRLVMEVFIGKCPDGLEVNHINGDKEDNHLENLEYVTHSENIRHAHKLKLIRHKSPYESITNFDIFFESTDLLTYHVRAFIWSSPTWDGDCWLQDRYIEAYSPSEARTKFTSQFPRSGRSCIEFIECVPIESELFGEAINLDKLTGCTL